MTPFTSHSTGRGTANNAGAASASLLKVSALTVSSTAMPGAERTILSDITFSVVPGEVVGVLGESGAGKSTLALALLRILPRGFQIRGGEIQLNSRSVLELSNKELRSVRGNEASIVYQDSSALNPVLRVDAQVAEVVRAHSEWNKACCLREAHEVLELVGLGEQRLFSAYPHQLSGGQKQRVAIAQALVCKPDLLIADEPTASLDASTTLDILNLIEQIRCNLNTAVLLISHQPEVLAYSTDRLMVLYAGQIVEEGPTRDIFDSPFHPYTRELLRCQKPTPNANREAKPYWTFIPGSTISPEPAGCGFENRCLQRKEICGRCLPHITHVEAGRDVRCFEYEGEHA